MPNNWPTVAAYFEAVLGKPLEDSQELSKEMRIDSNCGNECARAITSAGGLLLAEYIAGSGSKEAIISIAQHIVLIYIYG